MLLFQLSTIFVTSHHTLAISSVKWQCQYDEQDNKKSQLTVIT